MGRTGRLRFALGRGQGRDDRPSPEPAPTAGRPRLTRLCSVVAACSLSFGAVVVQQAAWPLTAAAISPSAVSDINPNSLTSGTLFGGRTVNFAVNPSNTNIVWAATEFGGLWESTNHGGTWSHVDQVPLTAMEDVKIASSDNNLIIATGAYDGSIDNRGGGIWRSTDGGTTWAKATGSDLCVLAGNNGREIAIAPGTPGSLTVLVGIDCGLAKSIDSGNSWTFVSPPGNGRIWDVKVRSVSGHLQVDACGNGGYVRSNDGGSTWPTETDWTAATFPHPLVGAPPAPGNPSLVCRLATAPQDANTVLMAARSPVANPGDGIGETYQFESDDGGVNWHNLNVSIDGNGRDPSALTFPSFDGTKPNNFEVFFLTDQVIMHLTCDSTATPRCVDGAGTNTATCNPPPGEGVSGPWLEWSGTVPHCASDPGDIAYDPTVGCPFLLGGDGGIFQSASPKDGCNVGSPNFPTWTQANVGLHALWIYQLAGSAVPSGTAHTDVYYGMQDNGQVCSNDDAATFHNCGGADVFNTISPRSGPPVTVLKNQNGGFSLSQEDGTTAASWTSPPVPAGGGINGVAGFGSTNFAFVTNDGAKPANFIVQVTTNSGSTWTQMGPGLPGPPSGLPNGEQPIKFGGTSATPVFYLELTVGGTPTIYRLQGPLNNTATLTAASTGLVNPFTFNVDPSDPTRLYTVDRGDGQTAKFSNDSGGTWTADPGLTSISTLGGAYPFLSAVGPNINSFGFDPASSTVLAGTQFSGIFASADGGATWAQVLGSQQIPRVLDFFFDTRNPNTAYVGSQGRGAWKIDLTPRASTLVNTGATSGDFNDQVTLSAKLYDTAGGPSVPILGAVVNLTLGSQICNGLITDVNGNVSCTITLNQVPGSYSLVASFAGNAQWSATSTITPFTINREDTALTYTGDLTQDYHDPANMSAHLFDPSGGLPIAGKFLTFTLGVGDTCTTSAPTDASGNAGCVITPTQAAGPYPLVTSFAGDAFYSPASKTVTFVIKREETTTTYTGPTVIANGVPTTFSGVLKEDGIVPIAGRFLTITLGSGITAQTCLTTPTDATGSGSCPITPNQPLGPGTVTAAFAGDAFYLPSSNTEATILFAFLDRGAFVIGDGNVTPGVDDTYWGAQWARLNTLSGGSAPNAFKGFASTTSEPPACSVGWTARPGNAGDPPDSVPSYMGVIVSTSINKHGSTTSGDTLEILVIKTDPGYQGNPGHAGTGTVVASTTDATKPAVFCHS